MTYKFDQFEAAISNPSVSVTSVHDHMNSTCTVDIKLTSGNTELGVSLTGFTYSGTWEDSDINSFVTTKLTEYEI